MSLQGQTRWWYRKILNLSPYGHTESIAIYGTISSEKDLEMS